MSRKKISKDQFRIEENRIRTCLNISQEFSRLIYKDADCAEALKKYAKVIEDSSIELRILLDRKSSRRKRKNKIRFLKNDIQRLKMN
ncbi:hypothetical protein DDZ16_16645 [Marinilabilia rubra]|uniref:Uncharacterized protein n=1 Tax=Marinilabilia rubra TaxID=2162893 RepID=A0A2U2B5A5_9BACT|nr:hypothetical protein DDZ16_16645 [Marinilabilia rubra]